MLLKCNALWYCLSQDTTCGSSQLTATAGRRWKHFKGLPESGKHAYQEKTAISTDQERTSIHVSESTG